MQRLTIMSSFLLPAYSKVFEKLVSNVIFEFVTENNLLNNTNQNSDQRIILIINLFKQLEEV